MKKVYLFGTGYCAKIFASKVKTALTALGDFQILGFLDNDEKKEGTVFEGIRIYNPYILKQCTCDLVLVLLLDDNKYKSVAQQLSNYIPAEKIQDYLYPLKLLLQRRYENSDNEEIKETLRYISDNKITVFNQFIDSKNTYDEVKWDDTVSMPYIEFTTVDGSILPMYYPSSYNKFVRKNGAIYVENLMKEQSKGSPHLYVTDKHNIKEGDCIIDAGVCEGNFALKYVNVAAHLYLFEVDPMWKKPLYYTFKKFEDKVTIIDKAVSDRSSEFTCQIDDIVSGRKVDFIKMDIEGEEVAAIMGAKETFRRNSVKSSICSYHKRRDEQEIRLLLEKYGYQTTVSKGYMLFFYDDDTWKYGDLRRGIVYGDVGNI